MMPIQRLSRRRLLQAGAAAFAFAPKSARGAEDDAGETLAARDAQNRLTIEAGIAGKGPYRFVVDTGADRTVLADNVANELGLPRGGKVLVRGIVRTVPAETVAVRDLALGRTHVAQLDAPVLPRAWLEADGYLGLDVLDGQRLVFDFRRREVGLYLPRPGQFLNKIGPNEAYAKAMGPQGRLRAIDAEVDGIGAFAFIDSGADVSVGNSALFAHLARRGATYSAGDPIALTGITGGAVYGRTTPAKAVKLGNLEFSDSALVIADLQIFDLWGLADRPALFIGMDLMRKFSRVTVDYGRKEFRFQFAGTDMASLA